MALLPRDGSRLEQIIIISILPTFPVVSGDKELIMLPIILIQMVRCERGSCIGTGLMMEAV